MKTVLTRTSSKVRLLLAIAVVVVALVRGTNAWAVASPESTTVGVIEYFSGTLIVQDASGVNFYGQLGTQTGCTANNQTLDTLKIWLSLGQAALLSGKNVKIYFATCGGINYISAFDLDR